MKNIKKTTKPQVATATLAFSVRANVRAGGLACVNHNRRLA